MLRVQIFFISFKNSFFFKNLHWKVKHNVLKCRQCRSNVSTMTLLTPFKTFFIDVLSDVLKIDGLLLVDLFSFVDNFEEKLEKNVSESKKQNRLHSWIFVACDGSSSSHWPQWQWLPWAIRRFWGLSGVKISPTTATLKSLCCSCLGDYHDSSNETGQNILLIIVYFFGILFSANNSLQKCNL